MIRNLILDWSGTLVDDLPAVLESTNHVFERAGQQPWTLSEFKRQFYLPFKDFYQERLPEFPLDQLEEWFHFKFRSAHESVIPLPKADSFLEFCREWDMRMFLMSALHPEPYELQAEWTGFGPYFEKACVGVADKRVTLKKLIEEEGLDPAETLFVGDMRHDVDAAKACGVWSCAVLTGYNSHEQLQLSEPDSVVEHLGELVFLMQSGSPEWIRPHNWKPEWKDKQTTIQSDFPIPTVGALILNSRKEVFLARTHKWSNLWGIPGGKIEKGELAIDALRREIREETGMEIRNIQWALAQDCVNHPQFYKQAHFVLLNYICEAVEPVDVRLNEESQEYQWLPLDQALRESVNEPTRILLEWAMENQGVHSSVKSPGAVGDSLEIRGMDVSFRVGVPDEERRRPQRLKLDISMILPFQEAADSDDLMKTVDYAWLRESLMDWAADREWRLIEKLVEDLAREILSITELPSQVTVAVEKYILPNTACVRAEITRTRRELALNLH